MLALRLLLPPLNGAEMKQAQMLPQTTLALIILGTGLLKGVLTGRSQGCGPRIRTGCLRGQSEGPQSLNFPLRLRRWQWGF